MKVLIISHNPFSTWQSMGKTLLSLFREFKREELMQIYLYPSLPNIDICQSYYRITDKNVIKAVFSRRQCGRRIRAEEISQTNRLYEAGRDRLYDRKNVVKRRIRDLLWRVGKWKTADLKKWLDEGKPDVVFYALGDATFSQNIALWAANYLNVPLITYVCDEFYFSLRGGGLLKRTINAGLIRNLAKTLKRSSRLITICEALGDVYQKQFGVAYTTIMTGSSFKAGSLERTDGSNQISYIGNFGLNRWKSLIEIAEALDELNEAHARQYQLTYYGTQNSHLDGKIRYGGRLDSEQVKKVMGESLMLIHTEPFDSEYRARLKYSISTKVADCLASGVCLLAYGPADLISIQYLKENECAVVATDKAQLRERLAEALADREKLERIEQKAITAAKQFHSTQTNSQRLYQTLLSTIG